MPKYWSKQVTEQSNALDLEPAVFKRPSPREIAASLKRSAEKSKRRKGTPRQSAMSMLNFYINRAGKNLSPERRRTLEQAKEELRDLFERRARPGKPRGNVHHDVSRRPRRRAIGD